MVQSMSKLSVISAAVWEKEKGGIKGKYRSEKIAEKIIVVYIAVTGIAYSSYESTCALVYIVHQIIYNSTSI